MQKVVEVLALGVRREMQPCSIKRDDGDGPILYPHPLSKWASFYVVGYKIHIMLEEE